MNVPKLDTATIQEISKILGDTAAGFTGSQIFSLLNESDINDIDSSNTKWMRLFNALNQKQSEDDCANKIIFFIQNALKPVKYRDEASKFDERRSALNHVLSFEGLEINKKGIVELSVKAETIDEARKKANRLKDLLKSRKAHHDIFKYCGDEINAENYFHVVFEATKSIFDKIREKSGLTKDGSKLVDEAFSFNSKLPILALNKLESETEKSEQKGFMNLIKGVYGAFRNPIGHEVKIKWEMKEEDALDALSLISLIHRKLDTAVIIQSKV